MKIIEKGEQKMSSENKTNRLNGKDLMNVGIFTAVFLVIEIIIACVLGVFPMGFLLISVVEPIILGIPMMLYFTRVKKFGMILITVVINGLIMILTGMGPDALRYGIFIGLLTELIIFWGKYKSSFKAITAYAVFGLIAVTNYIHWLNASQDWLDGQKTNYGDAFVEGVSGSFAMGWVFPVICVATIIAGFIGGLLGKGVLKKHFVRSGLI